MGNTINTHQQVYKEWLNILTFYEQDIKLLNGKLTIIEKNSISKEIDLMVIYLKHSLNLQQEDIKSLESNLKEQNTERQNITDEYMTNVNIENTYAFYQNKISQFESLFASSRKEVIQFLKNKQS